jgi:hypothetical protein
MTKWNNKGFSCTNVLEVIPKLEAYVISEGLLIATEKAY